MIAQLKNFLSTLLSSLGLFATDPIQLFHFSYSFDHFSNWDNVVFTIWPTEREREQAVLNSGPGLATYFQLLTLNSSEKTYDYHTYL